MKTLKHPFLALLSLVLISACAKKHDDPKPQAVVVPTPSVVGDYDTDCQKGASNPYVVELNYLASGRVEETTDNYKQDNCQGSSTYSVVISSNYLVDGLASAGVLNMHYAYVGVNVTPHDPDLAAQWNLGRGFCGITGWKAGTPQPLTLQNLADSSCLAAQDKIDVEPRDLFSIVKIDGNTITRGQFNSDVRDQDGYSAEHRFSKLEGRSFLKKGTRQADLTAQCPVFAAVYTCAGSGDADFNARTLVASKNGNEYRLEAKMMNMEPNKFTYVLDGLSHGSAPLPGTPGIIGSVTAKCAAGVLSAKTLVSNTALTNILVQDRTYTILPNKNVAIESTDTVKKDLNDNGVVTNRRIECQPL